jgi:fermentation-respiration switch protein FrsA (DUF1100 family)
MILSILSTIGTILGIIIGAYIIFLLIMALGPRKPVPEQRIERAKRFPQKMDSKQPGTRKDISFEVKGTKLSAWLFLPENMSTPFPCIIMAHGLGATKALGLETYALCYQQAGFAVLAFDYRHLGESEGEPRQLVWIPYQLHDYAAAVEYVRGLEEIDPKRIALWGSSLSGGHVIMTAAKDQEIACVSAQVPLLDGSAGGWPLLKKVGIKHILRMSFGHGVRDMVRSFLGLSPHNVPLIGKAGSIAALADSNAWEFINEVAPDDFVNEICARILIRMDKYHPINEASKVRCPVLIQVCDKDLSLPMKTVKKVEKLGIPAKIIHYPIDHFDIYWGENLENAINDQLAFFKKHLL